MSHEYCSLIVSPERRNALRLREDHVSGRVDRRTTFRYLLGSNTPFSFSGLDDPTLIEFVRSVCTFQNDNIKHHPEHERDMAKLLFERATHTALEGGVHAFFQDGSCIACFLVELLGEHEGHLLLKGGYLAVQSPREIFEFLDTLLMASYKGAWVVMRTWGGLRSLIKRVLNGKKEFGPWLEYQYDEFRSCLPDISRAYLRKRIGKEGEADCGDVLKEDNGNLFLVRPPVGLTLAPHILPSGLLDEDQLWLQIRAQQQLSFGELADLVKYYAQIERAGRLGSYVVPNVRSLQYGERL